MNFVLPAIRIEGENINNLHMIRKFMIVVLTLVVLLSVIVPAVAREDKAAQDVNISPAPFPATIPSCIVFIAVAIRRFNRQEF